MKYYTLKDNQKEGGTIRPLAGMWKYDEYGKKSAEQNAKRAKCDIAIVEITELK